MDRKSKELYLKANGWAEVNGMWLVPDQKIMYVNVDLAYTLQQLEEKEHEEVRCQEVD